MRTLFKVLMGSLLLGITTLALLVNLPERESDRQMRIAVEKDSRAVTTVGIRQPAVCAPSQESLRSVLAWVGRDDTEFQLAVRETQSRILSEGTLVKVLERDAPFSRVRVLDDDEACWISSAAITRP